MMISPLIRFAEKKLLPDLGAYWGNGFHEDGISSAYNAINFFKEATK